MKKTLSLLLIILILAFFITGCKEQSYASQSDADNENYEKATFGGG